MAETSGDASGEAVVTRGPGTAPAVLLLHPWWGLTSAVAWWADQLVAGGRRVLMPDLYGGRTADTVETAEALRDAVDEERALALIERCADELSAEGRPWAAMGFSMGALLACHLAGRGPSGPEELVLFYGGRSPGGDVRTRRVALHLAPQDAYFTEEEVAAVEGSFAAAGAELRVFRYEGSGHWFAEPGSPGFDGAAADLARSRVLDQLRA